MYNIIEQNRSPERMSIFLNDTTKSISIASGTTKIDCAKECPCGVPVIPVPDQWLEVMVTGGFKVWHIIFIIIAFIVTIVVVYCCFHRCRIPRTKQEIEADLMRTNLTTKFRDYLQEFPNEPTTFIEALKKVQELEEKFSEQDDSSAKKRKGWLKLKGKDRQEKTDETREAASAEKTKANPEPSSTVAADQIAPEATAQESADRAQEQTDKKFELDKLSEPRHPLANSSMRVTSSELPASTPTPAQSTARANLLAPCASKDSMDANNQQQPDGSAKLGPLDKIRSVRKVEPEARFEASALAVQPSLESKSQTQKEKGASMKEAKRLVKTKGGKADTNVVHFEQSNQSKLQDQPRAPTKTKLVAKSQEPMEEDNCDGGKIRLRRRKDKPNLSRTKAAHVTVQTDSPDIHNLLSLPTASNRPAQAHNRIARDAGHDKLKSNLIDERTKSLGKKETGRHHVKTRATPSDRSKVGHEPKHSTVIQIEPMTKMI